MYIPQHFAEPRIEEMHKLIRENPLATLITLTADGLHANHIPLYLINAAETDGVLQGHVARANPIWTNFEKGIEVLAVFQTENTYISPSWYASKQENGKVVPTWNYAAVHAYGSMQIFEDSAWIRQQLERLTTEHEARFPKPWALSDAPHDFTDKLLPQIVGIEIKISKIFGKWKVSQNQPVNNQASLIQGLSETGKHQSAELIAERAKLNHTI